MVCVIIWESLIGETVQCDIIVDVKLRIGGNVELWLGTDEGAAGLGQVRDALLVTGPGGAGEGASVPEAGEGLCNSRQMVEGSYRLMGCHCRWRQWLVYGGTLVGPELITQVSLG